MKNESTWTACAGRSLSSAHGSSDVPISNGPAGMNTSVAATRFPAGGGGASQHRVADPQLVRGEHRLVVLLLVLHDHAEREGVLDELAALQRDLLQHVEHLAAHVADVLRGPHAGLSSGNSGRPTREYLNAS